ncbi:MAG: metallophosphoesterase family protein [Gaiellaceae bacterium]|jgi:predicted phosphodiesterase
MRTALISDVHGNAVALDAVLADLERDPVDQVVCLGDMIQGGAEPAEVVRRLRELRCPVVLGNADAFLLDPESGEEATTQRQLAVREWTVAQIGADGVAFIDSFRPTLDVSLGDGRMLLAFHGSPTSFDDIVLPHLEEGEFRRLLGPPAADVLAGGHVHLQWLRRYGDSTFLNPGSVGLAYDHAQPADTDDLRIDAIAEYARLDVDGELLQIAFRRIPLDRDAVLAAIDASGMPHADYLRAAWRW